MLVGFLVGFDGRGDGDGESLVREAIAVEALLMEKMLLDKTTIASSCLVWFSLLGYTFKFILLLLSSKHFLFFVLFLHVNKVKNVVTRK